jgi:predicted kinase
MSAVAGALFVVVSGPPASGKSTLAPALSREIALPLVAKDTIKDALMSVLPVPDVEASRQIGRGAVAAMLAVAAESPVGAVIESNFYRSVAADALGQLPGEVIEVFCRCEQATAGERYRTRAGTRHGGHFDADRSIDELWNDEVAAPVAGGWPVLEVDTNRPVDLVDVFAFIRHYHGVTPRHRSKMAMGADGVDARHLVVSGPAASGKTLVARGLSDELGWPLFAKDTIKAALMSVLPVSDADDARRLGRAAVEVLLAVAAEVTGGAVLEAVWRRNQGRDEVSSLPGAVVEVFCRCDRPTLEARYAARRRPSGYVREHQYPAELWSPETFEPLAGGWSVIEVDTAGEVDPVALADKVRQAAR